MHLYSCTFRAAFQEGFRFFHAKCSEALCAVVEADDGRAADRIADIDGNKDKLDIQQDAIGRNAVFSEVSEQLEIIDHDDRRQDELQKFSVGKMVGKLDP